MIVKGRKVAEGKASGPVARSSVPISFLGEIDPNTGKVDNAGSELNGQSIAGQVLVFPMARGSTVGPYTMYGARKRGVGPVAMVVQEADAIVASAAVIARMPCVDQIDVEIFQQGETVHVDGGRGEVEVAGVKEVPVVTSFLLNEAGRVLLLKRSEKVGSFQGKWAGVSGYLESAPPREQAHREIREELSLGAEKLHLLAEGKVVYARDGSTLYSVHPFLFRVKDPKLVLDWEHTTSEWVDPVEIRKRETVPNLEKAWLTVAHAAALAAKAA